MTCFQETEVSWQGCSDLSILGVHILRGESLWAWQMPCCHQPGVAGLSCFQEAEASWQGCGETDSSLEAARPNLIYCL